MKKCTVTVQPSILCLLTILFSVTSWADLDLSLSDGSAVLSGVTPAGSVAWLAVGRESRWDVDRLTVRRTVEVIPDGSTTAELPWGGAVPVRSAFVAVDLETGRAATGSPHPSGLRLGEGGRARSEGPGVVVPGQFLQILVVRPGGGVWHGAVADGALEDLDGSADGAVSFDWATLTAVGDAPANATAAAGDRVWAIDLDTLVLHEIVLDGGAP